MKRERLTMSQALVKFLDNQYIEADGVVASEEAAEQWNALRKNARKASYGNEIVSPLVKTTWDQDSPFPSTGHSGAAP